MSLAGKVAVVTGAPREVGRAIALKLADDGADVSDLNLEGVEETAAMVRAKADYVTVHTLSVNGGRYLN